MKFICDEVDLSGNIIPDSGCGEIDHIIFDGYSFGDTRLEGVMFSARIKDGKMVVSTVDAWSKDPYLQGLNREHWLKTALKYAQQNDIATCPYCGNDINAQPHT